jgi:nucleotide-binding universal stress UspA family protein
MNNLSKILVPVDFSENSILAIRHAADLARHFRSEVTLLFVNELAVIHSMTGPLGYGISSWDALRAEHMALRQKELAEFGEAELQGILAKRVMRCGDPARIIVDHARTEKVELILMPTHGEGTFRRFLLGSVTAKVLHDANCPVWTGAHLAEPTIQAPTEIRHVMCAVDFGPQSQTTIRWAANFASEFGANLTAVHASLSTPPNLAQRYADQWHDEARWGAEERLRCLLLDVNVQADMSIVEGDVPTALGAAARETKAGLLVIGRSYVGRNHAPSGRGGRLGSDAYGIICHAPCPVVSV